MEKTFYIAKDGSSFETAPDCEEYEKIIDKLLSLESSAGLPRELAEQVQQFWDDYFATTQLYLDGSKRLEWARMIKAIAKYTFDESEYE